MMDGLEAVKSRENDKQMDCRTKCLLIMPTYSMKSEFLHCYIMRILKRKGGFSGEAPISPVSDYLEWYWR